MGIFLFKKHKKKQTDYISMETGNTGTASVRKHPAKKNAKYERLGLLKENCDLITENIRQVEEAKVEYQAVTSYLTDMQKIDMIPGKQREEIEDAAKKIVSLNKERNKYQNKDRTLSDEQYGLMERYELQIPKELESIRESEGYQKLIQGDIDQLEKEKQNLLEEEEDSIEKQSFLKGIAITTIVIILILFSIFASLAVIKSINLTIPFLLTVLMGMISAIYIFTESRQNVLDIKVIHLKQNRQVMLMNKVKLKSVNNLNFLEYTYGKYMVENYGQLKTRWDEYVKLKEEEKKYQSNTDLLEQNNKELIDGLKKYNLADAEIWIYQPTAIIDNKEMVEVRHRLNVRRQKLRERIDLNNKQMDEAMQTIASIIKENPEYKEEASRLLEELHRRGKIDE